MLLLVVVDVTVVLDFCVSSCCEISCWLLLMLLRLFQLNDAFAVVTIDETVAVRIIANFAVAIVAFIVIFVAVAVPSLDNFC